METRRPGLEVADSKARVISGRGKPSPPREWKGKVVAEVERKSTAETRSSGA